MCKWHPWHAGSTSSGGGAAVINQVSLTVLVGACVLVLPRQLLTAPVHARPCETTGAGHVDRATRRMGAHRAPPRPKLIKLEHAASLKVRVRFAHEFPHVVVRGMPHRAMPLVRRSSAACHRALHTGSPEHRQSCDKRSRNTGATRCIVFGCKQL
jgi:hypothetical protein